MKRIIHFIKDEFELSLQEARISLALLALLILFSVLTYCLKFYLFQNVSDIQISEFELLADRKIEEKKNFEKFFKTKDEEKFERFDPNTVDANELVKMGIPKYLANNLVNFRKKGMVYRTKEDLNKIYGWDEEWYAKLEPYIIAPAYEERNNYTNFERIYEPKEIAPRYVYKRPSSFDINLASSEELQSISGIGEVFANRIIKYRDALGGFHSMSQVKETYGLNPVAYDSLAVVAKITTSHQKFNINSIDAESFRHPYLKKYQVKGIVNYRYQHGKFSSVEDLYKLKVLDKEVISKITPYLLF